MWRGAKFGWRDRAISLRVGARAVHTHHLPLVCPGCSTCKPEGLEHLIQFIQSASQAQSKVGTGGELTGLHERHLSQRLVLCFANVFSWTVACLSLHNCGLFDTGFLVCVQACFMYFYLVCIGKHSTCVLTNYCMLASM